jgi:hypothetical protein
MKSIEDTLKLVTNIITGLDKTIDIQIAHVGGYWRPGRKSRHKQRTKNF